MSFYAAEFALPPLSAPFVARGGLLQIMGGEGLVTVGIAAPDGQHALATWTLDGARQFADKVEASASIAIAGPDGIAQVQLPGDLPAEVAAAIRAAADWR